MSRSCSFYIASTTELLYAAGTNSYKDDLVNQKNETTQGTSSAVSGLYSFPLNLREMWAQFIMSGCCEGQLMTVSKALTAGVLPLLLCW